MPDTSTTPRGASQFTLADMFRWSLVFSLWFAFCGIVPTTIFGAIAAFVAMAALVALRYYWVRGPQVPARLEWSYFLFVFSVAVFVSFASFYIAPLIVTEPALWFHPATRLEDDAGFFKALGWLIVMIFGHITLYAGASTLSFILALRHRPKRRMATFLLWINLPGLLLSAWCIFAVIAENLS